MLCCLAASAGAWVALPASGVARQSAQLSWWELAPAFALAETVAIRVVGGRTPVKVTDGVLAVGLFCCSTGNLVAGRLVGAVALVALHTVRRHWSGPVHRVRETGAAWRGDAALVVSALLDVPVALAVYRALNDHRAPTTHRAWLAGTLAVLVTAAVRALVTEAASHPPGGEPGGWLPRSGYVVLGALVGAVLSGSFGVAASDLWLRDQGAGGLLAILALFMYARHVRARAIRHRQAELDRLQHLAVGLDLDADLAPQLGAIVALASDLVRGDRAELSVLLDRAAGPLVVSLPAADRTTDPHVRADSEGPPPGVAEHVTHGSTPAWRDRLVERGWQDALVVPLTGATGHLGTLMVGHAVGRPLALRAFGARRLALLRAVAETIAVSVHTVQLAAEVRYAARHDAVTGLLNRGALQDALDACAAAAATEGTEGPGGPGGAPGQAPRVRTGRGWCVLLLDLDGFREVNSSFGHDLGDHLLREIGQRVTAAMPPKAVIGRLGADEFCVVLPGVDDRQALQHGRAILRALEQPVSLREEQVEIGGSVGVAVAPRQGTDASALLTRADVAMQAARGSDDGVRLYEAAQESPGPARLRLISDLRKALERQQLAVWLQPQLDLRTGQIVGAEALVRWFRPGVGYINPEQFVPVAERSGLIRPLTTVVLDQAVQFGARQQHPDHAFAVSVNISVRSLIDPDLVSQVAEALSRHGLPAAQLTLEITESAVMADFERTLTTLDALHALGVRLSIDDFGTGQASLAYVQRLPVDEIKIDQSFVKSMLTTPADRAIVTSIIQLAAGLGLETVAEGAEVPAHISELELLGCSLAQGFGIGRPMSLVAFDAWLAERRTPALTS